jgi:hypothetical protein
MLWLRLEVENYRLYARKSNVPKYMYIERNTNIAIFQIRYGYLNRIACLNRVSNQRPEKCGFGAIKKANL